jgi:hypothetical protein
LPEVEAAGAEAMTEFDLDDLRYTNVVLEKAAAEAAATADKTAADAHRATAEADRHVGAASTDTKAAGQAHLKARPAFCARQNPSGAVGVRSRAMQQQIAAAARQTEEAARRRRQADEAAGRRRLADATHAAEAAVRRRQADATHAAEAAARRLDSASRRVDVVATEAEEADGDAEETEGETEDVVETNAAADGLASGGKHRAGRHGARVAAVLERQNVVLQGHGLHIAKQDRETNSLIVQNTINLFKAEFRSVGRDSLEGWQKKPAMLTLSLTQGEKLHAAMNLQIMRDSLEIYLLATEQNGSRRQGFGRLMVCVACEIAQSLELPAVIVDAGSAGVPFITSPRLVAADAPDTFGEIRARQLPTVGVVETDLIGVTFGNTRYFQHTVRPLQQYCSFACSLLFKSAARAEAPGECLVGGPFVSGGVFTTRMPGYGRVTCQTLRPEQGGWLVRFGDGEDPDRCYKTATLLRWWNARVGQKRGRETAYDDEQQRGLKRERTPASPANAADDELDNELDNDGDTTISHASDDDDARSGEHSDIEQPRFERFRDACAELFNGREEEKFTFVAVTLHCNRVSDGAPYSVEEACDMLVRLERLNLCMFHRLTNTVYPI